MFSLRCEQLAAKFKPDVALKMSINLNMQFHHDQHSKKNMHSTMHLFIADISDSEEKWNIWFKMIMEQISGIT